MIRVKVAGRAGSVIGRRSRFGDATRVSARGAYLLFVLGLELDPARLPPQHVVAASAPPNRDKRCEQASSLRQASTLVYLYLKKLPLAPLPRLSSICRARSIEDLLDRHLGFTSDDLHLYGQTVTSHQRRPMFGDDLIDHRCPGSLQTASVLAQRTPTPRGGHARGGRDARLARGRSFDAVGPVAPRRCSDITSFGHPSPTTRMRPPPWDLLVPRYRRIRGARASRQGCVAFAAGTRVA